MVGGVEGGGGAGRQEGGNSVKRVWEAGFQRWQVGQKVHVSNLFAKILKNTSIENFKEVGTTKKGVVLNQQKLTRGCTVNRERGGGNPLTPPKNFL